MNANQIVSELARVRAQLRVIAPHLARRRRWPIKMFGYRCQRCGGINSLQSITLEVPTFNVDKLEAFLATRDHLVHIQSTTQILDAWCDRCKFDWQGVLKRIEPADQDASLINVRPEHRYNSMCTECLELAVRGCFRNGYCTAGYCVACRHVYGPTGPVRQYTTQTAILRFALQTLWKRRSELIAIGRETAGYDRARRRFALLL